MRFLNERQQEYAKLRFAGKSPRDSYKEAGFGMNAGIGPAIVRMEKHPAILAFIQEMREAAADTRSTKKKEEDRALLQAKVEAVKEAEKEVAAVKITKKLIRETKGKIGKDEIECRLLDLAEKAEAARDLGTARQCYEALGKNIGMFTPVQKIKIETVEDLTLDETKALINKLMEAKRKEETAIPVEGQDDGPTAEVIQ